MKINSATDKINKQTLALKDFISNASHELRTPLMSIQGYAEGLKYDIFDDQQKNGDPLFHVHELFLLVQVVKVKKNYSFLGRGAGGNRSLELRRMACGGFAACPCFCFLFLWLIPRQASFQAARLRMVFPGFVLVSP